MGGGKGGGEVNRYLAFLRAREEGRWERCRRLFLSLLRGDGERGGWMAMPLSHAQNSLAERELALVRCPWTGRAAP